MSDINWREIKGLTPNSPTKVLLRGEYNNQKHYCIGELGGSENAPTFIYKDKDRGRHYEVYATHFALL